MSFLESILILIFSIVTFFTAKASARFTKKWYQFIKFDYFSEKTLFVMNRIASFSLGIISIYFLMRNMAALLAKD